MMIKLQCVVPKNIESEKTTDSQIWAQEIVINKGEHLHIVAPSGSGKTSFILFVYGLRNDYSGKIFYDNQSIKEAGTESISVVRQKGISIVFQDLKLFDNETVRSNIEIKRQLNPYHEEGMIDEMAVSLGIESKLNQQLKTCSYGEQQRVAIIRALMQPFDFLLLDEPFSHLDEDNREKAMKLIYQQCEQRKAAMIFADLKPLEYFKGEKVLML
jgi:putative ABC transport system ATP-binding protein